MQTPKLYGACDWPSLLLNDFKWRNKSPYCGTCVYITSEIPFFPCLHLWFFNYCSDFLVLGFSGLQPFYFYCVLLNISIKLPLSLTI